MRTWGILFVMLLATACSGDGTEATTAEESASMSTSTESSPPPPEVSLRESCPQVEAAMPGGLVPSATRWQKFVVELDEITADGDLETKNAVENLQAAARTMASDPADYLDAEMALLDAIDLLADRCAAVGSSALQ